MQLPAPYPASRPRRLRRDAYTRALVREHRLHASDLIFPVFVHEGDNRVEPIASMPGVSRLSLDRRRCWVDVWALEDLLGRFEAAEMVSPELDEAGRRWFGDRLLALYRGPLLADDHALLRAERPGERLADRWHRAVTRLDRAPPHL